MQEDDDQQLALDQYLLDAASLTQPDEVRDFLERGANPNARRPQGYDSSTREGEGDWGDSLSQERGVGSGTALMNAVQAGPSTSLATGEVVELLIESGAQLDLQDDWGFTALHWAVQEGQPGALRLLVEAGADKSILDNDSKTALDYVDWRPPAEQIPVGVHEHNPSRQLYEILTQ